MLRYHPSIGDGSNLPSPLIIKLEQIASELGQDLVVHDGGYRRGRFADPQDGDLHLVLWASEALGTYPTTWERLPGELYEDGNPVSCYLDVLQDMDDVANARVEVGGVGVGELGESVYYCWIPLQHMSPEQFDGFKLDDILATPIGTFANGEMAEAMRAARQERMKAQFLDNMRRQGINLLDNVRSRISQSESYINEWMDNIANQTSQLRQLQREADALLSTVGGGDVWEQRFDQLLAHPRVRDITVTNGQLTVLTDDITLQYPDVDGDPMSGESRWLGPFRITFNGTRNVRVSNLRTKRGERDHPHAPGGQPCLGGVAGTISSLLSEGEYIAALEIMFQFLETFNPQDDYGRYAALWFDVPDARPQAEQPAEEAVVA